MREPVGTDLVAHSLIAAASTGEPVICDRPDGSNLISGIVPRPRIAIVSTSVPPSPSGQARVLGHLLGPVPAENCLFLTDQIHFAQPTPQGSAFANYRILSQRRLQWTGRPWRSKRAQKLDLYAGTVCSVFERAREISREVQTFDASVLVACTASPFDLPACTLVALRLRLPLVTYLFDDPIYQWVPGTLRTFARVWEPLWSRIASAVIVPNESMQAVFAARRRRTAAIVRNPVAPDAFSVGERPWPAVAGQLRIVYTGSVYHAQADAFVNLLSALKACDRWSLHIYTSQTDAELAAYGILGASVFRHDHVGQAESYDIQRSADVLFLPLAFRSTIQDVLRTSAPMKMGEYLASGRPILVHAPANTFVAQHIAANGAGFVVDSADASRLVEILQLISDHPEKRREVCENALRLAQSYSVELAREAFWGAIAEVEDRDARRRARPAYGSGFRQHLTHEHDWKTQGSTRTSRMQWQGSRGAGAKMKQLVKRLARVFPFVRRYLAEKQTLAANWAQAAAERDELTAEKQRHLTEIGRLKIALNVVTRERDALQAMHREARGSMDLERAAVSALIADRDRLLAAMQSLSVKHDRLTGEHDALTASVQAVSSERDAFATERDRVTGERDKITKETDALTALLQAVSNEREALKSELADLRTEMEKIVNQRNWLLQERSQHLDTVLGKLVTVQSQFGTLQRNIARAVRAPGDSIAEGFSRGLYLDLLEASLTGMIIRDASIAPHQHGYDEVRRELGRDWPQFACTMIGKARMRNLRELCETALDRDIPGDFLEAGVWRGGACIYMRGVLKAYGIPDRNVWVADSFAGLPPPDPERYPADRLDPHHTFTPLAVPFEEVRDNFAKYDLLDDQVRFLKGWFKDTLPNAPVERLAVLRLDGDMYESTILSLDALYWKLSPGGFVIIDDYILPACKMAVDEFRAQHGISSRLEMVDGAAVYWCKGRSEKRRGVNRRQRQKVIRSG